MQPAVVLDFGFQLARRPAGIAEREHRAGRTRRRSRSPSGCRASRSGRCRRRSASVEFSMKKSAECSTKPRPVSTGPPFSTLTSSAAAGPRSVRFRNDVELHQQIGEIDVGGRLVDDDAHRAFGRMRAHIDDAARETLVAHGRRGDQHLAVEIAAAGFLFQRLARNLHGSEGYYDQRALATENFATSSRRIQWRLNGDRLLNGHACLRRHFASLPHLLATICGRRNVAL